MLQHENVTKKKILVSVEPYRTTSPGSSSSTGWTTWAGALRMPEPVTERFDEPHHLGHNRWTHVSLILTDKCARVCVWSDTLWDYCGGRLVAWMCPLCAEQHGECSRISVCAGDLCRGEQTNGESTNRNKLSLDRSNYVKNTLRQQAPHTLHLHTHTWRLRV